MKIYLSILFCFFVANINMMSQDSSIVSLTLGNMWFYDYRYFSYGPSGDESDHRIEIKEVVGDTILFVGKSYKKIFVTSIGETNTTTRMEYWGLDSTRFYFSNVDPLYSTGLVTFFDLWIVNDTLWTTPWGEIYVDVYSDYIWDSLSTFQRWEGTFGGSMAQIEEWTISAFGVGPIDIGQYGWVDTGGNFWSHSSNLYGAVIDNIVYGDTSTVLGIHNDAIQPSHILLSQNYPNPFNPTTKINYEISEISFVTIKVYDVLGNEVVTLVNEEKPAGNYEVGFNASELSSGIYFYTLSTGNFFSTKKMILLK